MLLAQQPAGEYKQRVLEATEVDFLTSYYTQDGDNAAVTGGSGTEKLTDYTAALIVAIPLNDDDVLSIDGSISAYTSASSSNIDPFDESHPGDAFVASTGASQSDSWINLSASYTHNSDDRNQVWSGKVSVSSEFDYFSFGIGGNYARQFNEKNTEVSVHGNVYFDNWSTVYPIELRPFESGGRGLDDPFFHRHTITGNPNYDPQFTAFTDTKRTSYSGGFGFTQILSKNLQGALAFDAIYQEGLLSTPFQRVYFSDIDPSYIENFRLADDIERLPDTRLKLAFGGRLNYFLNEHIVVRTFYRYYTDDWGVQSHTASIEVPIKIGQRFTVYPSYRYYSQTAADYFAKFSEHLSSDAFYTSDYDLSAFNANQYGLGVTYTDIFTNFNIWKLGLKSIDLKLNHYTRDNGFAASIVSAGFKFVMQ